MTNQLSTKEQQIIDLVIAGKSRKEIALVLHITYGTLCNHFHRIYKKLNVSNQTQAVVKVMNSSVGERVVERVKQ